jgi:hypothetical protein
MSEDVSLSNSTIYLCLEATCAIRTDPIPGGNQVHFSIQAQLRHGWWKKSGVNGRGHLMATVVFTVLPTVVFTVLFFGIFVLLAVLKRKYGFTIEPTWIAVALLPAIIWLLFSDRLSGFTGFGVEVRLQTASKERLSLSPDSRILPRKIPPKEKGGEEEIPSFRQQKIAALDFELGSGRYNNELTLRYLEEVPSLKHIIFTDAADRFLAIAPASSLYSFMKYVRDFDFALTIKESKLPDISGLQTNFLEESDTRAEALSKMSATSELAVVNQDREFIGLVSRDAVLRDLIVEALQQD